MKKNDYEHIFFDLDGTLWNFNANAKLTQQEIFEKWRLDKFFINFNEFHQIFEKINHQYWALYKNGQVTKAEVSINRFYDSLKIKDFDNKDEAIRMSEFYIERNSSQPILCDGANEVLAYLQPKYKLHIITNGFKEAQFTKLEKSGLEHYFNHVILSEDAGVLKPHAAIFNLAFLKTGATPQNALIIGDDWEADIEGAINAQMDYIFYTPTGTIPAGKHPLTFVTKLTEIINIL